MANAGSHVCSHSFWPAFLPFKNRFHQFNIPAVIHIQMLTWQMEKCSLFAEQLAFREQLIPYIFAVGPPISLIVPRKSGCDKNESASLIIESIEREAICLP